MAFAIILNTTGSTNNGRIHKLATRKLTTIVIDVLEDIKARDIKLINVSKLTSVFDYIAIASADSTRQTKALARSVMDKVKQHGGWIYGIEGEQSGEWVLVDCGDIVVHIMQPAMRELYELEELWGEGSLEFPKPKPTPRAIARAAPAPRAAPKTAARTAAGKTGKSTAVGSKKASTASKVVARKVTETKAKKAVIKAPTTKKIATKKPAVKLPAAKKPVAKKPATKKPAVKKPVAGKPMAKKPAQKIATAKKPAAKKPVARRPASIRRKTATD